jgi:AraC-like DNA-binding protein
MATLERAAELKPLALPRPPGGPRLEGTEGPAWSSNGGPSRGHPARAMPFSFEVELPPHVELRRIHMVGVFARFAGAEHETVGSLGAIFTLEHHGAPTMRLELVNGRHYGDAADLRPVKSLNGDGTERATIGQIEIDGETYRVDRLIVDIPEDIRADRLKFRAMNGPSSFVIFDVLAETAPLQGCPFAGRGGGIALAEVGPIVRMGDRVRFDKALEQLASSLASATELDEARGQALTFLTMVTAAMMESGGDRSLHQETLSAARELDTLTTSAEVAEAVRRRSEAVAAPRFVDTLGPSAHLVDRALTLVDRNFAKDLTDAAVAQQLGLSTSHFRFLFKQATGQPFHKYLVSLRLEKARRMLVEQGLPVGTVAKAVGFSALSHFSRAFAQRFSVSPTSLRRGGDTP